MNTERQGASREQVREAILDAVGRLLLKYGYRKMTVEDIAREAGIGKGSVYLHFPSKEEVALGWFDRVHGGIDREPEEYLRIRHRTGPQASGVGGPAGDGRM